MRQKMPTPILVALLTAATFSASSFATINNVTETNNILIQNADNCCVDSNSFAEYMYDAINIPWSVNNDSALAQFGADNNYMTAVLDIYFKDQYLADESLSQLEGVTSEQLTEQLLFLTRTLEKISYSESGLSDVVKLKTLVTTLKPNPESLNYAQRLNLLTHFSSAESSQRWLNVLFNDFEKPSALSFLENTSK